MNIKRLISQIEKEEKLNLRAHLEYGRKKVGVGHVISDKDPSWLQELGVGDSITETQAKELFLEDLTLSVKDTMLIFGTVWENFPGDVQEAFISIYFKLGKSVFLTQKTLILEAYNKNWDMVANLVRELPIDSNKASRLSSKIRGCV